MRGTGTGMDPSVLVRAFEPFFMTKKLGKGTGLGLSQVPAFAKRHNGYTAIVSQLGMAVEVRISTPRAEDAPLQSCTAVLRFRPA